VTDKEYMKAHWDYVEAKCKRLEQIRQLEEEISLFHTTYADAYAAGNYEQAQIWSRILTRLESALADLRRGMTEPKP
jgi:hypothetical protein